MAVFDIDETSLSNRAEWLGTMGVVRKPPHLAGSVLCLLLQRDRRQSIWITELQGYLPNRDAACTNIGAEQLADQLHTVQEIRHEGRPGGIIQNRSAEAFLPRHLRPSAAQGGSGAPQESAPALEPTLQIYKELYRRGFSVTFITGRQASALVQLGSTPNTSSRGKCCVTGFYRSCDEKAPQTGFTRSFIIRFPIRRSGAVQQAVNGSHSACPVLGNSPPCE